MNEYQTTVRRALKVTFLWTLYYLDIISADTLRQANKKAFS